MISAKFLLLAAASVFVFAGQNSVSAAAPSKNGITLSPFEQQLSIAPDDPDRTFSLDLTNNTKTLQELTLSTRDFGSLNDTGGVLLEGSKTYTQKYGLTSWLALGTDTVVLEPGEKRSIPVTIENRDSLQPGGHYGAVVASVTSLNGQKDNQVVINQQLLSLLFVKKVGGERYNLKLTDIGQNGTWLHLPNTIRLRFQNPGNVHVIPRGIVRLKSPSGTVVAQGIINSESAYVLPETFRELYVPLAKVGSAAPLPGMYSVDVEYRYDGIQVVAHKTYPVHFVSLGSYAVAGLLIALAVYVVKRRKAGTKTPAITE